jgi:hypothetical protein
MFNSKIFGTEAIRVIGQTVMMFLSDIGWSFNTARQVVNSARFCKAFPFWIIVATGTSP